MSTGLAILCFLLTVSCVREPKDAIVGKWKTTDGDEVLQFFPDGTISTASKDGNYAGKFSFPDQEHIKLELGGLAELAGPLIGAYSISFDTLKLTLPGKPEATYKRIR